MKKTITVIYSIFAVVLIIGSILWFALTIYNDGMAKKEQLVHRLKLCADQTAQILNKDNAKNADLHKKFSELYKKTTAFHAILIKKNSDILFVWPNNTDVFYKNEDNDIKIHHTPLFVTPVQIAIPFHSSDNSSYVLYAALQTVSTATLFYRGKVVFFIIFCLFLSTIVLLICAYFYVPGVNKNEYTAPIADTTPYKSSIFEEEAISSVTIDSSNRQENIFHANEIIDEALAKPKCTTPDINEQLDELNDLTSDTDFSNSDIADKNISIYAAGITPRNSEEIRTTDPISNKQNNYEEVINKIDQTIKETASAGEDMTLLLVHTMNLPDKESILNVMKEEYDQLNTFFVFDDNTVGFVIYYASLTHGMQIANALYDKLRAELDRMRSHDKLTIGLTTRAGRLIPAHRMLNEAAAALKKTWEENTDNIIAFRVNPEKYRQFIAKNS